jgi:hypothetical protein
VNVKDINLNLLSREERDPSGRQWVRARVAGSVRNNNNVELKILDPDGVLVGMGFLGYRSGQLTFYDRIGRAVVEGYLWGDGNYFLVDLRVSERGSQFARGFVDSCYFCGSTPYGWFDRNDHVVGGGYIYSSANGVNPTRVRTYWSFETGEWHDGSPAYGEAEYDLKREATGSINSVLFDTERTAGSFFDHPLNLVPRSAGSAFFPRLTNLTGLAVTSGAKSDSGVTFSARRSDGSLVQGVGVHNPATYILGAGEQFTAYAHEIFGSRGYLLGEDEVGWLEVTAASPDVKVMFLECNESGTTSDRLRGRAPSFFRTCS